MAPYFARIDNASSLMNKSPLAALLLISSTCFAQTATHILPDGSSDMYVGFSRVDSPVYEGSNTQWTLDWLTFQALWSNGIFVSNNEIGMHLSDEPGIEYGPLIAVGGAKPRTDAPQTESLGSVYQSPSIGGFFNYNLTNNLLLTTSLLYGTGRYHGSLIANIDAKTGWHINAHNALYGFAGVTWANAKYTEIQYGITPEQASISDYPVYTPSAGLQDVHAGLNWNWDLSSKWMLVSRFSETHLMGSAVDSPLVEKQNNVTVSTGLVYRF
jgi:outer membrane scaffolding protein for murein synthesis (MipA/OmpV family)